MSNLVSRLMKGISTMDEGWSDSARAAAIAARKAKGTGEKAGGAAEKQGELELKGSSKSAVHSPGDLANKPPKWADAEKWKKVVTSGKHTTYGGAAAHYKASVGKAAGSAEVDKGEPPNLHTSDAEAAIKTVQKYADDPAVKSLYNKTEGGNHQDFVDELTGGSWDKLPKALQGELRSLKGKK